LASWFERKPSPAPGLTPELKEARAKHRVGIPRILNIWTTHQFWLGFFEALGIPSNRIVFSSDTSEQQGRDFGRGRGTVDCCYPVKCMSGHYGELIFGQHKKRRIDILFSPMIRTLPSFMIGHVVDSLSCPRVMAGPENIKAGFIRETDVFADNGIRYVSPLVSLDDPRIVPKQMFQGLADVIEGLTLEETARAVDAGYRALNGFNDAMRKRSRDILTWCAAEDRPCILAIGRPYHMDPGIGHEIEADLQAYGYPILWMQQFPTDPELLELGLRRGPAQRRHQEPVFDIDDVWPSSYSANTNEILWGAKVAARVPWITCVIRLTSYECGMDQPTFTPVQQIVEKSGTLFFSFQELDSTKPGGSVKIRVETISYYLGRYSPEIIARKKALAAPGCPLETVALAS
jgi:predicted nucleotide-binding protein (sugar kinase/HSP70/actin superfamily)